MSNWYRNKRKNAGLSKYEVSSNLGIGLTPYEQVESGQLSLNDNYLERFNYIINNNVEIHENFKQKLLKVYEAINNGTLKKRMYDLNHNFKTLSEMTGFSVSRCNYAINKITEDTKKCASDDSRCYLYDFLMSDLNKYTSAKKTIHREKRIKSNDTSATEHRNNSIIDNVDNIDNSSKELETIKTSDNIIDDEKLNNSDTKELILTIIRSYENIIIKLIDKI